MPSPPKLVFLFSNPLKRSSILLLIHEFAVVQVSFSPAVYFIVINLASISNLAVTMSIAIGFILCQ